MSPQILKVATSFGGSTNYNNRSSIGRFGMGMKTAGLSMAPVIQILSWQERAFYYRMTLDTEAIGRDKLNLIILPEPTLQEDIGAELVQLITAPMRYPSDASDQRLLASRGTDLADALGASGTIIYMPDCDRLSAQRDRASRRPCDKGLRPRLPPSYSARAEDLRQQQASGGGRPNLLNGEYASHAPSGSS